MGTACSWPALASAPPGKRVRRSPGDRRVVLAAVEQDGDGDGGRGAMMHASAELKADRAFVLELVEKNGHALGYASAELQADRAVVRAAVEQRGHALQWASPELQADRAFVLELVVLNGWALSYASPELQADRAVVRATVEQYGKALKLASPELQLEYKSDRAGFVARAEAEDAARAAAGAAGGAASPEEREVASGQRTGKSRKWQRGIGSNGDSDNGLRGRERRG